MPLSKKARRYQPPSQACSSTWPQCSCFACFARTARAHLVVPCLGATALNARARVNDLNHASPNALAFAPCADLVHAIVPVAAAHERQAVRAELQPLSGSRARSARTASPTPPSARQVVVPVLVRARSAALEERHPLVKHAGVAGHVDVAAHREGRPQVSRRRCGCGRPGRSAGATSAARRPRELRARRRRMCSRSQRGLRRTPAPSRPATGRGSRTRRPTDRSRSAPRAGSQHLIEQPAVHEQVERRRASARALFATVDPSRLQPRQAPCLGFLVIAVTQSVAWQRLDRPPGRAERSVPSPRRDVDLGHLPRRHRDRAPAQSRPDRRICSSPVGAEAGRFRPRNSARSPV